MKQVLTILTALLIGHSLMGETAPVTVTVRSQEMVEVNGVAVIPDGLLGITAYQGADLSNNPQWHEAIKAAGFKWVGVPGNPLWHFPDAKPALFGEGWADRPEIKQKAAARAWRGYSIPQALAEWQKLGITPMLFIIAYPEWVEKDGKVRAFPIDIEAAAESLAEYVAFCRNVDPDLKWVHLLNEPNTNWFKIGKGGRHYAEIFYEIAYAIHERNPGIMIGGPAICWAPSWPPNQNGSPDWYTWDSWSAPLIEIAGDELDFFDFHIYSLKNPLIAVAETQLVVNAMYNESGVHKPVVISEYGNYLKPEDTASASRLWSLRIKPWQDQIMAFLEYSPDKIMSLMVHDLWAQAGGQFRFMKGNDATDQYDFCHMFATWSLLSGKRVLADSSDPSVKIFAGIDSDALSLVLVNTSSTERTVNLDFPGLELPAGIEPEARSLRYIGDDGGNLALGTREGVQDTAAGGAVGEHGAASNSLEVPAPGDGVPSDGAFEYIPNIKLANTSSVTLSGNETLAIRYPIQAPQAFTKKRVCKEYFGTEVHVIFERIGDEKTILIPIPDQLPEGASATLRVAQLGAREGDHLVFSDGETTYDAIPEYFQEIPLKRLPKGDLALSFRLEQRGEPDVRPQRLRVSSVSLVIESEQTIE